MTFEEVCAFQRTHRNHLGKPLKVDGDIGPQTQWALDLEALGARGRIVNAALEHVGLAEQGTNRGPEIDLWLRRCGAPVGLPWCAAFASACVSAGGRNLHEASVARLAALLPHTDRPLPGDIGYYLHADGTGHAWIWSCTSATRGYTVEGNSDNAVRVWLRRLAECKSLRTIGLPTLASPTPPARAQSGGTR